jgi:hypothetical protein
MPVSRDVLLAGLKQLTAKYKHGEVKAITVQMMNGNPAYVMQGASTNPPQGLPGSMTLPDVSNRPVVVPVLWRFSQASIPLVKPGTTPVLTDQSPGWLNTPDKPVRSQPKADEVDLDRSMWAGASAIDRRDVVVEYQPGSEHVITEGKIPEAEGRDLRISVDTTGTWGWWSKPFDLQGCLCCTFYQSPVMVLKYTVPEDYTLTIDGWACMVYGNFFVGETFNVRFVRDGDTLLDYDEVIVDPANPDPAKKCLFSGCSEQVMDEYLRIDRNQTLTIFITPKGLFPFNKGPADPFCGTICILLHGHLTALLDNRDGAPRPKDVGRLRDDTTGLQCLEEVTEDDVNQLLDWIEGASANASMPAQEDQSVENPRAIAEGSTPIDAGGPAAAVSKPDVSTGNAVVGGAALAAILTAASLSGDGNGTPLE